MEIRGLGRYEILDQSLAGSASEYGLETIPASLRERAEKALEASRA